MIISDFVMYLHFFCMYSTNVALSYPWNSYLILCSLFPRINNPIVISDYHSDCHLHMNCHITVLKNENTVLIPECPMSCSVFEIISQVLPVHSLPCIYQEFQAWDSDMWNISNHFTLFWFLENSTLNKSYYFSSSLSVPTTYNLVDLRKVTVLHMPKRAHIPAWVTKHLYFCMWVENSEPLLITHSRELNS